MNLFSVFFVAGVLLAQAPDPSKAKQERDDNKQDTMKPEKEASIIRQDGTTAGGAMAPVDPKSFKVGPEDVIEIKVWREPDLSGTLQFVRTARSPCRFQEKWKLRANPWTRLKMT